MARIQLPDSDTLTEAERAEQLRFLFNLTRTLLRTGGCARSNLDLGFARRCQVDECRLCV